MNDISPAFRWNPADATIAKEVLKREGTPQAIHFFAENCKNLSSYAYWFILSTLWVSGNENTDLALWKELFLTDRARRTKSIMKPSEYEKWERLPWFITAYRAHRAGESDWIAYTLEMDIAKKFAAMRGVYEVKEYRIKKRAVHALFLRRGEIEIIVLDKSDAEYIKTIKLEEAEK